MRTDGPTPAGVPKILAKASKEARNDDKKGEPAISLDKRPISKR